MPYLIIIAYFYYQGRSYDKFFFEWPISNLIDRFLLLCGNCDAPSLDDFVMIDIIPLGIWYTTWYTKMS